MAGWIKLHRSLVDHELWKEKPFTRGQAWVDMLLLCNHEDREIRIGGKNTTIKRGQHHTSFEILAFRWGWTRKKVEVFLNYLEGDMMCYTERNRNGTTITIENYNKYQGEGDTKGYTKGDNLGVQTINKEEKKKNIYREFAKENDSLYEALLSWEEMRNKIKKPLTDRARESALRKLSELTKDEYTQIKIVDQSTLHNWQTFYGLKDEFNKPKQEAVRPWG